MALAREFPDLVRTGEPLAPYTWLQLGGAAEFFAEPTSLDQLVALVKRCDEQQLPVRLLGSGSNLLLSDQGVAGLVLRLSHPNFASIHVEGTQLTAGGGAPLAQVINEAIRVGLAGLEPLVGIPGTLGGAVHGNSGSRGRDIGQVVERARVLTRSGELLDRHRDELVFAYRQSSLDELAILDVTLALEQDDPDPLTKRMQKLWIVKKSQYPMSHERTACLFKDPRGMSASSLIDQAGQAGCRLEGVHLSSRDCNFVVVEEGATSEQVLRLMDQVRSRVVERLGVELETQLEIW